MSQFCFLEQSHLDNNNNNNNNKNNNNNDILISFIEERKLRLRDKHR